MNIQYDPESNILRFEISHGNIAFAKETNGTIIHMTASSVPVYIEVLDAGSLITKLVKIKKTARITIPETSKPLG